MNFQKIPPMENSKLWLDLAFRKAREKGIAKDLTGNWLQVIRQKEALKLDVVKDNLVTRLVETKLVFPDLQVLPQFYVNLMKLTMDLKQYRHSLESLQWAADKIRFFHRDYVRKIVHTKERPIIAQHSKECYGRISSVMKQIDKDLLFLEQCRQIMRTYPDIKEMFTVCIYGFPNVGKTTLLNKLAGTKAKVANYSFTTVSINAGYFELDGQKVQVLDVPGTLDRVAKMNHIELQADLVVKELAKVIIFVFDLSGYSGYTVEKQELLWKKLHREIDKDKKILVFLTKLDLTEEEVLEDFKKKFKQKYYINLDELKETVSSLVKLELEKEVKEIKEVPEVLED